MTLANIITIIRIIMVPIFLVILLTEMENKEIIAFIIFVSASVTDALDGYVARKYNQVTQLGKFLDPLADKLLVTAALIALIYLQYVETWVASIIIFRELLISAFRYYYLVNDNSFSASKAAKRKTFVQIVALSLIIIHPKLPFSDYVFWGGTILLYLSVVLTVYSGVDYLMKFASPSRQKPGK
jgi:CDP-diacylglycerol--glycerol-3-phosphate 3-phosphatidyltransferase